MIRSVKLEIGEFGRQAIERQARLHELTLDEFLALAAHYFVGDRDSNRLTRNVPSFPDAGPLHPLAVSLGLDGETWAALEDEAHKLRLPVERVLEYAALYLVADLDAGVVAARLAE